MPTEASNRSVVGVDFSGAKDAGRRIWIAEVRREDGERFLAACRPAEELDYGGRELHDALYGLTMMLRTRPEAAVGIDVPLGLPAKLADATDWEGFVEAFPGRFDDADAFREACRDRDGGTEQRRVTDDEADAPWSPYNHRMYRQTYHALKDLVAPLVKGDRVRVLPMQAPDPDLPWVMEVCPACTLKDRGLAEPYKGRSADHREQRERILTEVAAAANLDVPEALRGDIVRDRPGDALDAVVAATIVDRVLDGEGPRHVDAGTAHALEGYTYR